jgi:hypothetical protein
MANYLTKTTIQTLKIGARVCFPTGAESYPSFHFGHDRLTGAVVGIEHDHIRIRLDDHKPELDEWDNEIHCYLWNDDDRLEHQVERLLSPDDGTLDAFIQAYCPPRSIDIDGDVFGVMFTGLQTEWTESEAAAVIEDAARLYDLRNPNRA